MAKAKVSEENKGKQLKHAEVVAETAPTDKAPEVEIEVETTDKPTAKAGKRSAKSLKQTEEMQAKQEKKAEDKTARTKPETTAKPARTKEERAGKKYREVAKLVDKSKKYNLVEAIDLAIKTATTKFDSAVEMHVNLGVDPRQADQNVRDTVALPAGTGKKIRIAVLAEGEEATKAKNAGADIVGADEVFAKLDKEEIEFDTLICTPALMPKLGKYARLLGPRGLMPNPKSGSVSDNPAGAVKQAKAGRVEYRVDQAGIVHLAIGKVSFGGQKLNDNAEAVFSSIRAAKPTSLKGIYIKSVYLTTTMGPSVKVETTA
ncbi:MAG TPA: 50S ribosomal protein L1 [Candidatus Babeliales bacterium]|nr:50S ribosomal protein L1 [Candidatus Babeliales bacterium]